MASLIITRGPGVGTQHVIAGECVVGRGTEAHFPIDDLLVSRQHLRIVPDGPSFVLEDLKSRNGTAVNGTRVERRALEDGDVIVVGLTELVFRRREGGDETGGGSSASAPKPAAAPSPTASSPRPPAPSAPPAPTGGPPKPPPKPLPKALPTRKRRLLG